MKANLIIDLTQEDVEAVLMAHICEMFPTAKKVTLGRYQTIPSITFLANMGDTEVQDEHNNPDSNLLF